MKKLGLLVFSAVFFATLSGCGTLFNSGQEDVAMSSEPNEAEVFVDGSRVGQTPVTLELDNQATHTVTFRKEGYQEATCQIGTSVGAGYVVLDVLGGLVPVIIDAATGKWKSMDKGSCNVTLPQSDR